MRVFPDRSLLCRGKGTRCRYPFCSPARCRVTPGKARSVGRGRPAGQAPCRLRLRGRVESRARRRECGARDLLHGRALSADARSAPRAPGGQGGTRELLEGTRGGARGEGGSWAPCETPMGGSAPGAAGSALLTELHRGPVRAVPTLRLAAAAPPGLSDPGTVPHSRHRFGRAAPHLSSGHSWPPGPRPLVGL